MRKRLLTTSLAKRRGKAEVVFQKFEPLIYEDICEITKSFCKNFAKYSDTHPSLYREFHFSYIVSTTIILFHVMYKIRIICDYSYTYLFLLLRSVFHVALMQTKLYRSFPLYIKFKQSCYIQRSARESE